MRLTLIPFVCLAILAGAGSARAQDGEVEAAADALVHRWTEAMGGTDVWDGVRDMRYVVTTVWYDTASATETRRRSRYVWLRRDGGAWKMRVERREAEGHYVQSWDGSGGWATLNGDVLADTASAVREIEYITGDLTYWPGLPWKLRDPGVNLRHIETDANASGPVVAVTFGDEVGLHPRDRFWWYFGDPESPFPTEVHYIEQDKTARDRAKLTGWVGSGPFRFARWRRYYNDRDQPIKAILYSDFEVNRGVPARHFERPAG